MLDSPQVQQDLISSMINFVYELPHKLPNELGLFIIGWRESQVPSLSFRNKVLVIAAKNYAKLNLKFFAFVQFYLISLMLPLIYFRDCTYKRKKCGESNIQRSININSNINIRRLIPRDIQFNFQINTQW